MTRPHHGTTGADPNINFELPPTCSLLTPFISDLLAAPLAETLADLTGAKSTV
jgi:hypothetical protein